MGAIYIDTTINRATIDQDQCVECGTCARMSSEHLNPTMVRSVRKLAKLFRFRFDPEPDVLATRPGRSGPGGRGRGGSRPSSRRRSRRSRGCSFPADGRDGWPACGRCVRRRSSC
jgi:hypothetical protein